MKIPIVRYVSFFLMLFVYSCSDAQVPSYVWAKTTTGNVESIQRGVVVDIAGNSYFTGVFFGTVDFDPGPAVVSLTPVPYGCNVYIAKYDASGNFLWVKNIPIAASYGNNSIGIDNNNNLFITGFYSGSSDFDPGAGVYTVTSAGGNDMYLAKYDTNGNFIWAKSIGSTGDDRGNEVLTDAANNVYVAGDFSGAVDFDPGPATAILTSAGVADMFIAKYDANGNYVWVKQLGGAASDDIRDIAIDGGGNIVVTGYFNGSADFDPTASVYNLISSGSNDIFISKYDPAGNFIWAKGIGSTGSDISTALTVNSTGDLFLTGIFSGTVDFDAGVGSTLLTAAVTANSFILRYDALGNFQWVKKLPLNTANIDIALDQNNTFFISGSFGSGGPSPIDMDPDAGVANLAVPSNLPPPYYNIFARYTVNGTYLWSNVFGHTCYCSVAGYKSSLAIKGGYIYYSGIFNGSAFGSSTVDFDPGAGVANLTAPSSVDNTFFAKYGISYTPLPVELMSFTGMEYQNEIQLNWTTATEVNNDYFEVERSLDAVHFDIIGKVAGGGTSSEVLKYQLIDPSPVAGINYYRLKQVDYDGTFEYSFILPVLKTLNRGNCNLEQLSHHLYELHCPLMSAGSFAVSDVSGRLVMQGAVAAEEDPLFDLSTLQDGVYFLAIQSSNGTNTYRLKK